MHPNKRLLYVWRVCLCLISVPPAFLFSFFMQIGGVAWIVSSVGWVAVFLFTYSFYLPVRWRGLSFSVDKLAVCRKSGVLFRKTEQLPLTAVRFTTIKQGPITRMFGLCTLRVAAAGTSLFISGLHRADASALASALRQKGGG